MTRPLATIGVALLVFACLYAAQCTAPDLEVHADDGSAFTAPVSEVDTLTLYADPGATVQMRYSLRTSVDVGDTLADLVLGLADPARALLMAFARSGTLAGSADALPAAMREEVREIQAAAERVEVSEGTSVDRFERELLEADVMGAEDAERELLAKIAAPPDGAAAERGALEEALERKRADLRRLRAKLTGTQTTRRRAGLTTQHRARLLELSRSLPSGRSAIVSPVEGVFTPVFADTMVGYVTRVRVRVVGKGEAPSGYRLSRRGTPRLWARAQRSELDADRDTAAAALTDGGAVVVLPSQ